MCQLRPISRRFATAQDLAQLARNVNVTGSVKIRPHNRFRRVSEVSRVGRSFGSGVSLSVRFCRVMSVLLCVFLSVNRASRIHAIDAGKHLSTIFFGILVTSNGYLI